MTPEIPHLVALDELHMFCSDAARVDIGKPTLSTLVATGGKRNLRFLVASQLLSGFPEEILGNVACRIIMRLSNPKCIWLAQRSMGLLLEQAAKIPELKPREAMAQYNSYPAAFKVRVDELSFPPPPEPAALEAMAQAFLAQSTWTEEAVAHKPQPNLAITGDSLKVFQRMAEHAEPIPDRCNALEIDRAQESRARAVLKDKGFIEPVEQTLAHGTIFYILTEKGSEWARQNNFKVRQFKSGPLHEHLLNHVEKAIGVTNTKFTFQRNSQIARDHGLEPDSVLHIPGGQRAIIEICCTNMDYEARNLRREQSVDGVDMVLAVTPNARVKKALAQALEKCAGEGGTSATLKPLILLDAGECFAKDFNWATVVRPC